MSGREWDREADLLVVGSGAAGLSAAIVAASLGLKPLVLEKTDLLGGSTAISGGVVWIAENRGMAEAGAADPPGAARRYLEQVVGDRMRSDLIDAYIHAGKSMVDFFNAETAVKLVPRMYAPDYQSELEGASPGGRALDPIQFDGRRLGRWFDRLRPPLKQMTIFDGMMVNRADIDHLQGALRRVRSLRHSVAILGRYARDRLRFRRGTRLLAGNALAAALLRSALDRDVAIETGADVIGLIKQDGAITGLTVRIGGKMLRVRARKGVVLAAGGGAANVEIRRSSVRHADVHQSMAPEANVGDALRMAAQIGAVIEEGNVNPVFLAPVSVNVDRVGRETLFPHLILDRQKPGLIAVNAAGHRFVNEADSYHDFVEGMYRDGPDGPAVPAWLIADARFVARYGLGLVRPRPFLKRAVLSSGYLIEAPTIRALAVRIGVPGDALEATVEQANRAAATGVDEAFGKGSTGYNRYLGDPVHKPNPCLGPIKSGPFYGVKVWPGDIGATRGIRTDGRARVLEKDGNPIPGLYACGNDMNSIMGGTYPAGGITLGPAMTFGYIAAHDAAGNFPPGDPS